MNHRRPSILEPRGLPPDSARPRRRPPGELLRILCLLLCIVPAAAPVTAQPALAARVAGTGIPLERLERQFEQLLRERQIHIARLSNPVQARRLRREALEQLLRIELFWLEAQAEGRVATALEVDQAVASVRGRVRSDAAFELALLREGHDPASYREHVRKLLSAELWAQHRVAREVTITQPDIEAFYRANPQLFERSDRLRLRRLLLAVPASAAPAQWQAARERLLELRARIVAGEAFDELARRHSDDPTRAWGGEAEPVGQDSLPAAQRESLQGLAVGDLSAPIETAQGWLLLRLEGHEIRQAQALEAVHEAIRERLVDSRGRDLLDAEFARLRARHAVEVLTPL
jgi:parvulin-like peptidyl-prolyl isomerase